MKKIIKLALLIVLSNVALISMAQKNSQNYYDKIMNSYYLYSSDDKVFSLENHKWVPVFYDETVLNLKSKIKTNASFTVKNHNRIYYCPASQKGQLLGKLIDQGVARNKQKEWTVLHADLMDNYVPSKKKYHYLLLGLNECTLSDNVNVDAKLNKGVMERMAKLIHETMDKDTDYVEGYHKILFDDNETIGDSILNSLNAISKAVRRDDMVLIYIASPKPVSLDTINTYVNKLDSVEARSCIYIDTNDTKSLVQNLCNMNSICTYILSVQRSDRSSLADKIVNNWKNVIGLSSRTEDIFNSHYYIVDEWQ